MNWFKNKLRQWLEVPEPFEPADYWVKQHLKYTRLLKQIELLYGGGDGELYLVIDGKPHKVKVEKKKV